MRSLRNLSAATLLGAALLLAALVLAGIRQNKLAFNYRTIVQESESIIFLYTTIKDQATQGILSRDKLQILGAAKEFEQLQSKCVALLDNSLIQVQYKLSLLQELDFERMVVNLRNFAEKPLEDALVLQIIDQLRLMNKQFLQFDRVVVNGMRSRVMEYQKIAMILMGLITSLACYSLIVFYQNAVGPLVDLAIQAERALRGGAPLCLGKAGGKSTEISTVINAFNHLLQNAAGEDPHNVVNERREAEFSTIINEATNRLNGIINYSQLLKDSLDRETSADEQKQIIEKIIHSGERCAVLLRKGLQRGDV